MPDELFDVMLTPRAKIDLIEIFEYILNVDGIEQASSIHIFLEEKMNSLSTFPERGKYCPEFFQTDECQYRELDAYPWRIFYKRIDHTVVIVSVLDGRRDLGELLKERLLKN